ncbi:MAG: ABC transporter permease [Ideonella sp.]|nr:ABC transporter permease [Ideonella sp.]
MSIGAMAILLFGGFSANIKLSMETAHVRTGGHLQVQHRDFSVYGGGNPTAYGIGRIENILSGIRSDEVLREMVLVATPSLQFGGIAGNYPAGVSKTVLGIGLVAEDHSKMRLWNDYQTPIVSSPMLLANTARDAAVIGTGLARILHLCAALKVGDCPQPLATASHSANSLPDDIAQLTQSEAQRPTNRGLSNDPLASASSRIELLASNSRGTPNVAAFSVVSAENQGIKALDDVYMAVHLPQAQRLVYGAGVQTVTSIMIQLRHSSQMPAAQSRLESKLSDWSEKQPLAILDFGTVNPFYVQTIRLFDTLFGFIFILIGSIALFTVSNTMNTSVVERTVEIGTLRAIGLRRAGIRNIFIAEGVVLGSVGATLGVVVAIMLSGLINRLGFEWLPPGNAVPMPLVLRVWGESGMLLGTTLGLIVIATLSAWWPAHRAARLNVVDALRHV